MNEHAIKRSMKADGYSEEYIERITDDLADYRLQEQKDRESAEALAARRKTYEVTVKRTCLYTYHVEAENEQAAKTAAWSAIERSVDPSDESVSWDIDSVSEEGTEA